MPLILNIETATNVCSVSIANGRETIAIRESREKNIHAAKVTVFAADVCREASIGMNQLDAIAVSKGPGSYTGLRIGVSTAKGFCYALDIPLISVPTLQSMALQASRIIKPDPRVKVKVLYCPMIDARRMEVYTALYDTANKEISVVEAMIIDEASFEKERAGNQLYYFGDGAEKCKDMLANSGMNYIEGVFNTSGSMAAISAEKFKKQDFENLAYFEPYYLKDFIAGKPKVKGLD